MLLVPGAGIEPARAYKAQRILSPSCLPIPPPRQYYLIKAFLKLAIFDYINPELIILQKPIFLKRIYTQKILVL